MPFASFESMNAHLQMCSGPKHNYNGGRRSCQPKWRLASFRKKAKVSDEEKDDQQGKTGGSICDTVRCKITIEPLRQVCLSNSRRFRCLACLNTLD